MHLRTRRWLLVIAAIILLAGCLLRPDRPLRIAAATVAHDLCSQTFVAGLDPDRVFAASLAPRHGLDLISWAIHYDVDRVHRQVAARVADLFGARAVYYDGLGCIVSHGAAPANLPSATELAALRTPAPALLPEIEGQAPDVVAPIDAKLKIALDNAFAERDAPPYRRTKAVVVVHDGRIIAERYAPGYGVDTPLLGFSMTKSVVNALIGILVREGRLKLDEPAPVSAWADARDPRHRITIEELMRMASGLALDEDDAGFANPSDRMLYLARDMAADAESAPIIAAPGTRWAYSSASTHILARIVRDAVGGRGIDALSFAEHELFAPLGMRHVTMEVDATGTMIGSHYMLAPARDWARFGLLYLGDGLIGGRRILPAGWVAFSVSPTLGTDYGAGFWTARGGGPIGRARVEGSLPGDAFFAFGNLGQRLAIVPSHHLVVVRLGDTTQQTVDSIGMVRLIREVIDALGPLPAPQAVGRGESPN